MDQDFYNGIEPSSMSVDDILREFHEQESAAAPPVSSPPADAPRPRRQEKKQLFAAPLPRKKNSRAPRAETEKPMDFDADKQSGSPDTGIDEAPRSVEDILREYEQIFAEKPVEAPEEDAPEETAFFMPAAAETPKASAADYAAFAAGTSAVAASREKISALSSMADEALQYMNALTDEDFDRLAAASKAPNTRDAGAERYNLSGHESKMVFGDKELDLSPDEDYTPTAQKSEPIYHWTAAEEEVPERPTEKPGFLQRIMNFNASLRPEKKPRPNTPARRPYAGMTSAEAQSEAESPVTEEAIADNAPKEKAPAPDERDFSLDFSFDFDDTAAAPAAYAPEKDYQPEEYGEDGAEEETDSAQEQASVPAQEQPQSRRRLEEEIPLGEDGEFPSFGQYVSSLFTAALFRLRGYAGSPDSVTMDTEDEDLGPELKSADASKYYGSFVPSLRLRFRIALGLLAVMAWISLGLPVSGMLRTVRVAAGMCLALQLAIMLLNLDIITNAAVNLARLRFGADSLVTLCCVLTSFDALAVALDAFGSAHMPLCLLSSLSLTGMLYASLLSARGLRKALRVPSIAKLCYSVTGEAALKGKGITLLKSDRAIDGFVHRSEEAVPDETAFLRAAPVLLIVSLLFAIIVSAARHAGSDFLYLLTALLTPAVPLTALLCFALPFFIGSNRIFYAGAAVAGWSGLSDVGCSQNLIITDRDLFPDDSVEIETIRIFADADPERILSYAGTMVIASGAGIAPCFAELMNRNGGTMRQVENFEFLPGGGMKGTIDGSTVLCGSTELMRLMNVRIPYRLIDKTAVLLAVDGVLYGIFNMKYLPRPEVHDALVGLIRSSRHPVFAVRDFNINPEMLRELFDVATDGYDFPPYMERLKLSDPPTESASPVAAVICRDGLGPLSLMADTGRNMYLAVRLNLIVTILAAVIGVLVVFIRFLTAGQVGIPFLLLYLIIAALPVVLSSLYLRYFS